MIKEVKKIVIWDGCQHIEKSHLNRPAAQVKNSEKWPFHGIAGKSQGIYQAPQGICENSKISGNSQGMAMADLSVASDNVT